MCMVHAYNFNGPPLYLLSQYTAPPRKPYPSIEECLLNTTGQRNGHDCNLHVQSPTNITCSVFEFYPTIHLYFRRGTSVIETVQTIIRNNSDGTRNKTITITAEASDAPYTCVATVIPGLDDDKEQVTSILLHAPPDGSTTTRKPTPTLTLNIDTAASTNLSPRIIGMRSNLILKKYYCV